MGKKTAAGLLGSLITAGVALGVAKYLKDYAGVKFTDDEQIDRVKSDSTAVREAAKRTYIAIKEQSNIKEAAAELSKAAGSVMTDAADIAKTAGNETVQAFKDMKVKYDEDPDAFKSEFADNINDMTHNIAKSAQDKTEEIVDRIKTAYNDFDVYEIDGEEPEDESSETEHAESAEDACEQKQVDADGEHDGSEAAGTADAASDTASETESQPQEDKSAYSKALEQAFEKKNEEQPGAHKSAEEQPLGDGSFKLSFVDDNKSTGSNVTITDDAD